MFLILIVTDREAIRPVRVGLELIAAIARLHGSKLDTAETWKLYGSREQLESVKSGSDPAAVSAAWAVAEARWRERAAGPY